MKPTREQIEHRAIEILKGEYPDLADYCMKEAERQLIEYGYLTVKQKHILGEKLSEIENATRHPYKELTFHRVDQYHSYVDLAFTNKDGTLGCDTISGTFVSFADDVFENGRAYDIERLLHD